MADKKMRTAKRKSDFFYFSNDELGEDFDSDDSVVDQNYMENENGNSGSSDDSETVSQNNMWLVPF